MLIAWPADDHAVVMAIGAHDQSSGDVYAVLRDALGLEDPKDVREKPPCCDEKGQPPDNFEIATDIAEAVDRHVQARRRGR